MKSSIFSTKEMGLYYGVSNCTKKESVSGYWKGDPWCSLYSVMHEGGWTHNCKISSSCYDRAFEFVFDEDKKAYDCELGVDEYDELEDGDLEECEIVSSEKVVEKEPYKIFSFSMSYEDEELTGDHCPEWEDGKCKKCGYKLDLESRTEGADTTYFCN